MFTNESFIPFNFNMPIYNWLDCDISAGVNGDKRSCIAFALSWVC